MRKFKRLSLKLISLALCFTIGLSVFSLTGALSVAAASGAITPTSFFNGTVEIPESVYYGDTINVPKDNGGNLPKIVTPSGNVLTLAQGATSFKATLLGYYELTYTVSGNSYTFRVLVKAENEWVIEVENNGADIPTYYKLGETVTIPKAEAVVYDDEDEVILKNTDTSIAVPVTITVTDPSGAKVLTSPDALTGKSLQLSKLGSYFVRYAFNLPGGTSHVLTKDYTILVQDNFTDTEGPTISVSNPNQKANINVAYTIPNAVATDNFDENIKVVVSVTKTDSSGNEVKVKMANVDDNGFATSSKDTDEVFNNNRTMKFYPMEMTTYKITYTAYDDMNLPSATLPYFVEVEDNMLPTIELEESAIPLTWGSTVYKRSASNPNDGVGVALTGAQATDIVFPYPTVYDNSHNVENVTFAIRDKDGKDVISFSNLLTEAGRKATIKNHAGTDTEYTFSPTDGLRFNFNTGFQADNKLGEYTVVYTARDAARRTQTSEYTINYQDEYRDLILPTVQILDYPRFFVWDTVDYTSFTVPTASVSDSGSGVRTYQQTYLVVGNDEYEIEAGDVLEFKPGLEIGEDEIDLSSVNSVKLKVVARDHATNEAIWESDPISVASKQMSNVFSVAVTAEQTLSAAATTTAERGQPVVVADTIVIGYNEQPDFVGFEVRITEPNSNNVVSTVEMGVKFDETNKQTTISDVKFTPAQSGAYTVTIRAFDFGGNQAIYSYTVYVKAVPIMTSSTAVSTTIEQGVGISLPKLSATIIDGTQDSILAELYIKGPHFSLRGYEMTALATGDYTIDYYAEYNSQRQLIRTYNTSVKNTENPTLKIVGTLDNYTALYAKVYLPEAIAIDRNGIAPQLDAVGNERQYSVDVKNKNGNRVPQYSEEIDGRQVLYFIPDIDGRYTITYKAYNRSTNQLAVDVVLYIYAGDITPPNFVLVTATPTSMNQNDFFFFSRLTLTSQEDLDNPDNIYYKKTLIFPDNTTEVVEGRGETYRLRQNSTSKTDGYQLTQSGTYKVIYEVTDNAGNTSKQEFTISVAKSSSSPSTPITALSTVLVVLGVLMLLGVAVYIWRFKPVKESKV